MVQECAEGRIMKELAPYDAAALADIRTFKNPESNFFGRMGSVLSRPMNAANAALGKIPGLDKVCGLAASGIMATVSTGAAFTVRTDAIFREFREKGHARVQSAADIAALDLEQVDRVVGHLAAKYDSLAGAGGATIGLGSMNPITAAAAVAADVPVFAGLCFRAIGEYATYYGFDISDPQERMFMMHVFELASESNVKKGRKMLVNKLGKMSRRIVFGGGSKAGGQAFSAMASKVARLLGLRLTQGKMAMLIPAAGVLLNSGFNVYMMDKVCSTASMMYRERFLARRYGDESLIGMAE